MRAPIGTTLMQVASRLLLVWGIVNNFPFVAKSAGYSSMLFAWGVTEVIRYGFFVFTLSGFSPRILSWLRYNLFLILYPLGAGSEAFLIYKAVPAAKKMRQEYAWVLQLILFIYVPGKESILSLENAANSGRFLHTIHAHVKATKEDHEGKESAEGGMKETSYISCGLTSDGPLRCGYTPPGRLNKIQGAEPCGVEVVWTRASRCCSPQLKACQDINSS